MKTKTIGEEAAEKINNSSRKDRQWDQRESDLVASIIDSVVRARQNSKTWKIISSGGLANELHDVRNGNFFLGLDIPKDQAEILAKALNFSVATLISSGDLQSTESGLSAQAQNLIDESEGKIKDRATAIAREAAEKIHPDMRPIFMDIIKGYREKTEAIILQALLAHSKDTERLDCLLNMIAASSSRTAEELFGTIQAAYTRNDIDEHIAHGLSPDAKAGRESGLQKGNKCSS